MSSRRLLAGGGGSFPTPPEGPEWPAEYLTLAHNNDYAGGGSFDNYLHAFTSPDGIDWTKIGAGNLSGSIFGSVALRDPDLMFRDNKWWGAAQDTNLRILSSSTFIDSWSSIANVTGMGTLWAPAWFVDVDESVHVVFGASNDGGSTNVLYEVHPTNDAMTTWSSRVQITGSGFPSRAIDPQITYWSGTYYMLLKDDATGFIIRATSSSPFSGYTVTHTGDWAGWGGGGSIEGPKVVENTTGWRMYFTQNSGFDANGIWYSQTTDRTMASGWSQPVLITDFAGYNHPMPIRQA